MWYSGAHSRPEQSGVNFVLYNMHVHHMIVFCMINSRAVVTPNYIYAFKQGVLVVSMHNCNLYSIERLTSSHRLMNNNHIMSWCKVVQGAKAYVAIFASIV